MKKKKILFWDDDQYEMLLPFVEYLRFEGFEVIEGDNPRTAREKLEKGLRPDLIISDLKWRRDTSQQADKIPYAGVDFCKFVRNELNLQCPIIVVTVVTEKTVHREVMDYVQAVLVKPVYPEELAIRIWQEIKKAESTEKKPPGED